MVETQSNHITQKIETQVYQMIADQSNKIALIDKIQLNRDSQIAKTRSNQSATIAKQI